MIHNIVIVEVRNDNVILLFCMTECVTIISFIDKLCFEVIYMLGNLRPPSETYVYKITQFDWFTAF